MSFSACQPPARNPQINEIDSLSLISGCLTKARLRDSVLSWGTEMPVEIQKCGTSEFIDRRSGYT